MKPLTKILVVDDEPTHRFIIEQVLLAEGYEVKTARTGDDAIALAASERFHLVLTDLLMPGIDGIDTILSLRASQPDIRIIAMSGGITKGDKNFLPLASKIGACRTLAKPFERLSLLAAIEEEIGMGSLARA